MDKKKRINPKTIPTLSEEVKETGIVTKKVAEKNMEKVTGEEAITENSKNETKGAETRAETRTETGVKTVAKIGVREKLTGNDEKLLLDFKNFIESEEILKEIINQMSGKVRSYGDLRGTILLKNLSLKDRKVLEKLFLKPIPGEKTVFKVSEFTDLFKNTVFREMDFPEFLRFYTGEKLIQNKILESEKREDFLNFITSVTENLSEENGITPEFKFWTEEVRKGRFGSQKVKILYRQDKEKLKVTLKYLNEFSKATSLNPPGKYRLALLSAGITSDPHAFDLSEDMGILMINMLSVGNDSRGNDDEESMDPEKLSLEKTYDNGISGKKRLPLTQEEKLSLLYSRGIIPDSISSFTVASGIDLYQNGERRKAYEDFNDRGEPFLLSLSNLSVIDRAVPINRNVFIIENQSVFLELCDMLSDIKPTLVCTSGQLKTASYILLDFLKDEGAVFHYSGDMDPEGINIAERFMGRYPNTEPWFFEEEYYRLALSGVKIREGKNALLENISNPVLRKAGELILSEGKYAYQEKLTELMAGDIRRIMSNIN